MSRPLEPRWRPLPLITCQTCGRKYDDARANCRYCGVPSASQTLSKGTFGRAPEASRSWRGKALFTVVLLVMLNVWRAATGDVGPDPEVEALHSEEEAVRVCRDAVESRLAARDPSIVGPERRE
jgi:hypothetical protein